MPIKFIRQLNWLTDKDWDTQLEPLPKILDLACNQVFLDQSVIFVVA